MQLRSLSVTSTQNTYYKPFSSFLVVFEWKDPALSKMSPLRLRPPEQELAIRLYLNNTWAAQVTRFSHSSFFSLNPPFNLSSSYHRYKAIHLTSSNCNKVLRSAKNLCRKRWLFIN